MALCFSPWIFAQYDEAHILIFLPFWTYSQMYRNVIEKLDFYCSVSHKKSQLFTVVEWKENVAKITKTEPTAIRSVWALKWNWLGGTYLKQNRISLEINFGDNLCFGRISTAVPFIAFHCEAILSGCGRTAGIAAWTRHTHCGCISIKKQQFDTWTK